MYRRDFVKRCTYINFRIILILIVIEGMISFQVLANNDIFTHTPGSPTLRDRWDLTNRSKDDSGGVNGNLNLSENVDVQRTRYKRRTVSGGLPATPNGGTADETNSLDKVRKPPKDSNSSDSNVIILNLLDEDLSPSSRTRKEQVNNVTDNKVIILNLTDEDLSTSSRTRKEQVNNVTNNNVIILKLSDEDPSSSTTTEIPSRIIGNGANGRNFENGTGHGYLNESDEMPDNGKIQEGINNNLSGRSRSLRSMLRSSNRIGNGANVQDSGNGTGDGEGNESNGRTEAPQVDNGTDSNEIIVDLSDEDPSQSNTTERPWTIIGNGINDRDFKNDTGDGYVNESNEMSDNGTVQEGINNKLSGRSRTSLPSSVIDNGVNVPESGNGKGNDSNGRSEVQVENDTDDNLIILDLSDEVPSLSTTTQTPSTIIGNEVKVPDSGTGKGNESDGRTEEQVENDTDDNLIILDLSDEVPSPSTTTQTPSTVTGNVLNVPDSENGTVNGTGNESDQVENDTDDNLIILDLSDEVSSSSTTTQTPSTVTGNGVNVPDSGTGKGNESDQVENDTDDNLIILDLSDEVPSPSTTTQTPSTVTDNGVNVPDSGNRNGNESDGRPEGQVENDTDDNLIILDLSDEVPSPSTTTQTPSTVTGNVLNVPDSENGTVNGTGNESDQVENHTDDNLIILDLSDEVPSPSTTTQTPSTVTGNVLNVPDSENGTVNGTGNESDQVENDTDDNLIILDLSDEVPSPSTTTQTPSTVTGNVLNVPDSENGTVNGTGNESDQVENDTDDNLIILDLSDEVSSPSTTTQTPSTVTGNVLNVPDSENGTVNGTGNESDQVENDTDDNLIILDLSDEVPSPSTTIQTPSTVTDNGVNVPDSGNGKGNESDGRPEGQVGNDTDDNLSNLDLSDEVPSPSTTTQTPSTTTGNRVTVRNPGNGTGDGRPEVQIENSTIRGGRIEIDSGEVLVFYGIPYGAPPVDKLRFKPPSPADPIIGTFDAITIQSPCFPSRHERASTSAAYSKPEMDPWAGEDCLYLNVWLPSKVSKTRQQLPVLVWVHGEGFLSGRNEEDYDSIAWFVKRSEIIVVAIQYRQGVFGFLHMGLPEAPGNMGLLDQIQALKWIEQNIEAFGGNPNTVAIMGHDIGAAFVGFHLLSNNTPNCFHRAIMLGGAPTQPHVFKPREKAYQASIEFAAELCANSSKSILNCLLELEAFTIWEVLSSFTPTGDNALDHPFVPTNDALVLDASPLEPLESGEGKLTQILIGGTSNEGSSLMLERVERIHPDRPTFICQSNFESILGQVFRNFTDLEMKVILHEFKNWGNLDDGFANQRRIAEIFGDYYFTCPIRKFAELWFARDLITYYYAFSHRSTALKRPRWMGTAHGDEIDFLFGVPIRLRGKFKKEEVDLSTKAMSVLVSFIKTETLEMQASQERSGKEKPQNGDFRITSSNQFLGPRRKTCDFWNELFPLMKRLQRCMKN